MVPTDSFFRRSCRYARDSGTGGGGGSPMSSLAVVDGGLFAPKRSLDRFSVKINSAAGVPLNVVCVGDSIGQGTGIPGATAGYLDGYCTRLQRAMGNAFGGNMGGGFFGLWRSLNTLGYLNSIGEWTFAGTLPTQAATSGPNALMPYGGVWQIPSGSGNVATFTPPPNVAAKFVADCQTNSNATISSAGAGFSANHVGQAIYGTNIPRNACIVDVAAPNATISLPALGTQAGGVLGLMGRQIAGTIAFVRIYWVDNAVGGTWSWSTDGGATWNDVASTTPAVATLKTVGIATALPSGLKIRGANAAGAGHSVFIAGVSLFANNPAGTAGVVVHNLCRDGAVWNSVDNGGGSGGFTTPAGTGDYWRILDNNGDSTQISLQPSLVIAMFSNDADLLQNGTITIAQFQANIQAFINRMFGYCDLLLMNPMEQSRAATPATQASMRQALKDTCVANNVAYLDIYDAWAAQGTVGFAACNADGLMLNPVHPSLEGHADIAGHIMRAVSLFSV